MLSPLALILLSIALVCLGTRVRTGLLNKQQSVSKAEPKEIALLPYWLPWIGHTIQFGMRYQNFLADARSLLLLCPAVLGGWNESHANYKPAKLQKTESSISSLEVQSTTLSFPQV